MASSGDRRGKHTVLVIGGGLAGCAAARALTDSGHRAIVLEASNVVGGRCRQVEVGGVNFEAGCEFLHGGESAAKVLADEVGLPCERVFTTAHGDGGPDDEPAPDGSVGFYYVGETLHAHDSEALTTLNDALGEVGEVTESGRRSLEHYLRGERGVGDEALIDLAKASYSNTLGVGDSLDCLPLAAVAHLERLWSASDGEGDYRAAQTHSLATLTTALATGSTVHVGCVVRRLVATGHRTVLAIDTHGRRFEGIAAIVAVPVSVLQRRGVHFSPELPLDKWEAICSIQMREAVKVICVFESPPWAGASDSASDGSGAASDEGAWPKVQSVITAGRPGEVVPEMWFKRAVGGEWLASGFATGAYAAALASLGEPAAVDLMVAQLCRVLPGKVVGVSTLRRRLRAAKLVDWSADEHVLGGYSAPSFGEGETARLLYRRPEWRGARGPMLGFAGEASEDAMMTMSAAINSGRRAVANLAETLVPASRL